MARREEGLLDLLVEVPWWVSIIVGVIVYIGMRFMIPALSAGSAFSNALAAESHSSPGWHWSSC